jgi:pseudouridine-5'-phosphate glycosidase
VCAGAKSILDIQATLEYLETAGVPVITYGSDEFPAFYSRKSGVKADCRLDSIDEIGALVNMKSELGLKGGVLVACPIPEEDEIPFEKMDGVIQKAVAECEAKHVKGKEITPFLLSKVKQITEGKSLEANIKLVLNNADIGSKIAGKIKY